MIIDSIQLLFQRDLHKLKNEISQYSCASTLWMVTHGITNSGGNLCLHLIGNLKYFVGSQLGNTGYERKRDLEFSARNIPIEILLQEIDETIQMIDETLSSISDGDLKLYYPILVFKEKMTVGYFLIHLATHFNYHLGQINYHRRLLDRK